MALHQEEHTLAIRQQLKQEGCRSLVPHKRKLLHSVKDQKKNYLSREVFNRLQGLLAGELFADWTDRIDSIRRRRPIKTERECADNLLRVTRNGLNSAYREELYGYLTLSAFELQHSSIKSLKIPLTHLMLFHWQEVEQKWGAPFPTDNKWTWLSRVRKRKMTHQSSVPNGPDPVRAAEWI